MERMMSGDGDVQYMSATPDAGSVLRQLNAVESTTAEIDARLANIVEKLYPVLAMDYPSPGESIQEDRPNLPPLATRLYSLNERLMEMDSVLCNLASRIDL